MLSINRQCDYAARIILYLAMQPPGTRITAKEVAHLRLIPPALARRIVTQLVKAGFLRGRQGKGGGFSLARTPAEISLLEVVEAMEGPIALNLCVLEPQECPLVSQCPVHEVWVETRQVLRNHLGQITFQELAERGGNLVTEAVVHTPAGHQ